jgi:hypothetical protein
MQQGADEDIWKNWWKRISTLFGLENLKKHSPLEDLSADGWAKLI